MEYLPLFFRLSGQPVLVVGGGEVAARKVNLLCRAGAKIRIIAPELAEETRALVAEYGIEVLDRIYQSTDINGFRLVVSATDDDATGAQIFEDCQASQIFINSVDRPERSNVIFPAIVDLGDFVRLPT